MVILCTKKQNISMWREKAGGGRKDINWDN